MTSSMPTLVDVMTKLASTRSIFHSEADFQHAFAWELHRRLPDASVTLERPYAAESARLHLDLLVQNDGCSLAVELKYKTKKFEHLSNGHSFYLLSQGAQDIGRYNYLKDIWRLEIITKTIPNCTGWAVLLTNDSNYWTSSRRSDTVDAAFRLTNGTKIHGVRDWGEKASAGTKKNCETPISLENAYHLQWSDYSELASTPKCKFRYLAVEVLNGRRAGG